MHEQFRQKILQLSGPILVLGASGFIGANLFKMLLQVRSDVYGTSHSNAWRLIGDSNVLSVDLLHDAYSVLEQLKPATIFDCVAYGAYSFEENPERIYEINVVFKVRLMELMQKFKTQCYIHAGSSSEYGEHADQPTEDSVLLPNSHYAVSKAATSALLYYSGKHRGMRCANLRLYSVYGPLEEPSRLIPSVVAAAQRGTYPPFVDFRISRDFVEVSDACEAFICAALSLTSELYGHSFNVGTGISTTIEELATVARDAFGIAEYPVFSSMSNRAWDFHGGWRAQTAKTSTYLGWKARTSLKDGLLRFASHHKFPYMHFSKRTTQ